MDTAAKNAQIIINCVDELSYFIESILNKKQESNKKNSKKNKKKKKKFDNNKKNKFDGDNNNKYSQIEIKIINLHLSMINKDNDEKVNIDCDCDKDKYSKLINPNKRTNLYFLWKNDFCLNEETEDYLLNWMMFKFPFKKYGFGDNKKDEDIKLFLKQQQRLKCDEDILCIKSNISNKSIIEYDIDLIVKILNKFYDFRLRHWCLLLNKTLNMFFKNEIEQKWWNKQLNDLNNINSNEWFSKCILWKIPPSKLLKDLIAEKKLFINDYTLSINIKKYKQQFLNYYDKETDLNENDYFKPLNEINEEKKENEKDPIKQSLKANRNKGYKLINTFLSEIGKIPHSFGSYDKFINDANKKLKTEQYNIYNKWIKYTEKIHHQKYMKYLKKKIYHDIDNMNEGIWYKPFEEELDEYKNDDIINDKYSIPNSNKLLTISVCEEICKILLMDGMMGINKMFKSHLNASRFEQFVFNSIKTLFDININNNNRDLYKIMNESDIRSSQCPDITPDVLFNCSVNINDIDIYWMDMKHYYVTTKDPITFKSLGHQITNYTKTFGNGAIICCGFQTNFIQKLKKRYPEINAKIIMLDASNWYHSFKKKSKIKT